MELESSQSGLLDVWRGKAAQSSENKTREEAEERDERRGVSSPRRVQFAVCTLQAARSGHENKLNYIERNGTGLEVAGLAGTGRLDGIGFEFEEGGKPPDGR